MLRSFLFASLCVLSLFLSAQVSIKINPDTTGVPMSPNLVGAFFEDINYAADGGLYAELIQNRSFEYYEVENYVRLKPLEAWELVMTEKSAATMCIESDNPLNNNNTNYLHLTIDKAGKGAGIRNLGFDGISVDANATYLFSMYARSEKPLKKQLNVVIQDSNRVSIGSLAFSEISTEWKKYEGTITCSRSVQNSNLVITTKGKGDLYFDMISLFPDNTYKGRTNGLRNDLAQTIADLEPQFLRFPGGCISHGRGLDNAYRWKDTVGPVEDRNPNWNTWGYHQTYGLGFFEYFQYCEDIGAIPLPVVPIGVSCQFRDREIAPMEDMQLWVDDALDLVEFANGAEDSEWGSLRASMGHPEPFNMEFLCLGNEEDNIPEVRERMKMITDSLRKYYPEIKVIGTSGVAANGWHYNGLWEFSKQEKLDAVDEHYYVAPSWLLDNQDRYDDFDRNGPKVFIGEWASRDDRLRNAIAEAAYMTGVERNADVIQFTCYAPLLSNEKHHQWNPDLIRFDNDNVVKTANYYVQQLYSKYTGDEYLPSTLSYAPGFSPYQDEYFGKVGVGTWNTQSEFDDIKVVSGDKVLFTQDFSNGAADWTEGEGEFIVKDGIYLQSSGAQPALSSFKIPVDASTYTYSLRAKKNSGAEGFLIPFAFDNRWNNYWVNIGGWGNTRHAIQKHSQRSGGEVADTRGSIETGVWYDIRIEVDGLKVACYLNDELILSYDGPVFPVSSSVVKNDGQLIVKVVNSSDSQINANLTIEGLEDSKSAQVIILAGDAGTRNSPESPEAVAPVTNTIKVGDLNDYKLEPNSFKVIVIER